MTQERPGAEEIRGAVINLAGRLKQYEMAAEAGVNESQITKYKDPVIKARVPAETLCKWSAVFGGYEVADALGRLGGFVPVRHGDETRLRSVCEEAGGRYVPGAELAPATAAQPIERTALGTMAEAGELITSIATKVQGGIDPAEAVDLDKDLADLEAQIAQLRSQLQPLKPRTALVAKMGGGLGSAR